MYGQLETRPQNDETLSGVEVVYAESKAALEVARGRGLNRNAELRTTSPALLAEPTLRAIQADAVLTPSRVKELEDAVIKLSRDCLLCFTDDADVAVIVARAALLQLQPLVARAATITEEDFKRPIAVVQMCSEDPHLHEQFSSPIPGLLSDNPRVLTIEIAYDSLVGFEDPRPPAPSLFQRLAFSSPTTLALRLVERVTSKTGLSGICGSVFLLRENELSKETAFWMLLRGFVPRRLDLPKLHDAQPISNNDAVAVCRPLRSLFEKHLGSTLAPRGLEAAEREFGRLLVKLITRYKASIPYYRDTFDGYKEMAPRVVFTNHLNDPELVGLHHVLRERRIPLVAFQHGVTVEINRGMRRYDAQFDSAVADIEVNFNHAAAAVSMQGVFRRGRSVGVGLPADYTRRARFSRRTAFPPIWYVSTALYLGNEGQLAEGVNDSTKARYEQDLIEHVLARISHGILYKIYPGRRYIDPDPVVTVATAAANITVFHERIDTRYISSNARIFITSRSFSTPSWCLTTGMPVVHIDIPDQSPLAPEARDAFQAGLFLFDAGAPDFHEQLRMFLDRPLEVIEQEWRDRAPARKDLMRRFVTSHGTGAGRRAAAEVVTEIRRYQG